MYFLGIDVNTYRVEAAVLDSKSGKVQSVSEAFIPLSGRVKQKQIQPRHVWEKVREVTGKLLREHRLRGDDIVALSVTSTQDVWVPVGSKMEPLYPLVNIQLNPFEPQDVQTPGGLTSEELFKKNGRGDLILNGAHNLIWFQRNEPDLFQRTYKWLNIADFIKARMTGEAVVDAAAASRYGVLDVKRRSWSPELISGYGINSELLPEIVSPSEIQGRLTRRAAMELGLKEGTPVVTGSSGPACAVLACCLERCSCLNLISENELILTRLSEEEAFKVNPADGYTLEPHISGSDYLCIGMLPFSIPAILWVVENFFPHLAERPLPEIYASLQVKLELVPPTSNGVYFLPHIIGSGTPKADYKSRGTIIGLRPEHSKWHVFRAVLEGVAYELRQNMQVIAKATGREFAEVAAFGWGAENRVALQIKADVTGVPFSAGSVLGGPACGAAHLTARAMGYTETRDLYCSVYSRTRALFHPDKQRQNQYNLAYTRIYTDLYRVLQSTFAKLA
ncbi:MAG: hypothetical protein H0Z38_06140 [Firmicutes bacterium]|nr:hypothetical protein [Bacillota bacterium]